MKCKDCYARNDSEKCLIGKKPRMLVCGHYGCDLQKKTVEKKMGIYTQTNADRLRSMSDEELAKMISGIESFALICGGGWPPEKWLDWLKREAT